MNVWSKIPSSVILVPTSSGLPVVLAPHQELPSIGERAWSRLDPCLECEPGDTQLWAAVHLQVSHSSGLSAEERQAVQGLVIRQPGAAVLSEHALFPLLAQWVSCLHRTSTRGLAREGVGGGWEGMGTEICGGRKTGMRLQVQAGCLISHVIIK